MKLSSPAVIALLASFTSAATIKLEKREYPLNVQLTRVSNSKIKIQITNNGMKDLRLLNKGTILDTLATEKLHVFSQSSKVAFEGIHVRPSLRDVSDTSLTTINSGETIHMKVDIASVNDVTDGGIYSIFSHGAIPYVEGESSQIANAIPFKSNTLQIEVNGVEATKVPKAFAGLGKRSAVQSDCTGSELDATLAALSNCIGLANDASTAARSGDVAKFEEYFHTDDQSIRDTVADRLAAVAQECSSTDGGATTYHCSDVIGGCSDNVLAYTLPSENLVVNCPLYFSDLPGVSDQCHAQDQATTTIHEFTHAPGVYSPGTADNAYGYDASVALDTSDAVLNADTYALFSNAIHVGC